MNVVWLWAVTRLIQKPIAHKAGDFSRTAFAGYGINPIALRSPRSGLSKRGKNPRLFAELGQANRRLEGKRIPQSGWGLTKFALYQI